jgi:hypothetical protein
MNHLEASKSDVKVTASVATNATHSHEIDTIGFNYLSVDVIYGAYGSATSQYATVLKLQESDTSGSGQVDVSGFTVTAGAGATTGAKNGAVCRFNLDLRGNKRYVTVVTTPGSATPVVTSARLSKANDMPYNATTAGVNNYVSG